MWDSITTNNSYQMCEYSPSRSLMEHHHHHHNHHVDNDNNKENVELSPMKEDLSFYDNLTISPVNNNIITNNNIDDDNNGSPKQLIQPSLVVDYDLNSRDSGYLTSCNGENSKSFGSSLMEDDFFEDFLDLEPLHDEYNNVPQDIDKLIKSTIPQFNHKDQSSSSDCIIRPLFRRALSLQNDSHASTNIVSNSNKTNNISPKVRSCLFKTTVDANNTGGLENNGLILRPFKRPEPPVFYQSSNVKKFKTKHLTASGNNNRPVLQRTISATEESTRIMCAVQRSSVEPDLIGDFTKSFCLPLTQGRHQDLKAITPTTLAALIDGVHQMNVATFKIIDCRYPYEFDAGHINGAVNIYTKEQCMELLNGNQKNCDNQRNILVFHCEFSSERGPNLYRYLRKQDRQLNQDHYPALHYPEIYLLEGGYKQFFEQFSQLCDPIAYKQMLHPEHENDLRFFRQKSKTWNVDTRQRPQRSNFKRLGL